MRSITIPGNIQIEKFAFTDNFYEFYNSNNRVGGTYTIQRRQTANWEYIIWNINNIRHAYITQYRGNDERVTIPSTIENVKVKGIFSRDGQSQNSYGVIDWNRNSRTKICIISKGIEFIGYNAFSYSNLTTLQIPDSVRRIGIHAFLQLKEDITTIKIGSNVEIEPPSERRFIEVSAFNFVEFYYNSEKRKGTYRYVNETWTYSRR